MFVLPISKHVLKALFFDQNSPKMKLFLKKIQNFRSAGGSVPRPPCLRQLGALPPNPQPLAAGGFAPRPPLASGGWGLRPQTPKQPPPIANFWLSAWIQFGICPYYTWKSCESYIALRMGRFF